jgi:hypothetical protein
VISRLASDVGIDLLLCDNTRRSGAPEPVRTPVVEDGGGEDVVGEDVAPFIRGSHMLILEDPGWCLGYPPSGVSADL